MTDTVTEAAVEAGLAAMHETIEGTCLDVQADGSCDRVPCQCRREVRAILSAAIPLVVAGERAELLIALHDAIRRPLGVTPDSAVPFYDQRLADDAERRRAAAIRADKGGE